MTSLFPDYNIDRKFDSAQFGYVRPTSGGRQYDIDDVRREA